MKVPVGSVEVELDDADRIVGHLKSGKDFEPRTRKFFAERVIPRSTVVDIGCYSGLFSIAAVLLGAHAIGLEPMPANRDQIAKNMKANGVDFDLLPYAASDKSGTARLGYNPKVRLTAGASLDRKSGSGIRVPTITLDELPAPSLPLSVIKIDVEGHEPAVLRGAHKTIKHHRPTMIIEANDDYHRQAVLHELARIADYELLGVFDVRNLVLVPR